MKNYFDKVAANTYLKLMAANDSPDVVLEQCPEHVNARWYHLFWFCVPMIGWLIFMDLIKKSKTK